MKRLLNSLAPMIPMDLKYPEREEKFHVSGGWSRFDMESALIHRQPNIYLSINKLRRVNG